MEMQEYGETTGNALAQKFYFEYQQEGFYKISAMHTGKCLTAKGNNITEGVDIVQYDYQGLDSQKWSLINTNNGYLIAPLSNLNLVITIEGQIQNGAKLILSNRQDNINQIFSIIGITSKEKNKDNGIYQIAVGRDLNKSIEIARK